ncbi:DUF5681 domain-containing protein [Bradyrhizobium sp. WSM2793]|uniref:DUF5681 domain-containing protein n=1 Tax=Bradyrhizobium sp. WSM2793 TaxID=1038866 RepID=UPI00039EDD41|nr:DUF5681 domain-containing protein [Bradyrhizobium sp. WSM2793]
MQGRFKKGQSGNPSGKRKPRNPSNRKPMKWIAEVLHEELQQEITVSEHGKEYKITKLQALVKQAVTSAVDEGELRPLKILQGLEPLVDGSLQATEARHREQSEARERVTEKLNRLSQRLLGRKLND